MALLSMALLPTSLEDQVIFMLSFLFSSKLLKEKKRDLTLLQPSFSD